MDLIHRPRPTLQRRVGSAALRAGRPPKPKNTRSWTLDDPEVLANARRHGISPLQAQVQMNAVSASYPKPGNQMGYPEWMQIWIARTNEWRSSQGRSPLTEQEISDAYNNAEMNHCQKACRPRQ